MRNLLPVLIAWLPLQALAEDPIRQHFRQEVAQQRIHRDQMSTGPILLLHIILPDGEVHGIEATRQTRLSLDPPLAKKPDKVSSNGKLRLPLIGAIDRDVNINSADVIQILKQGTNTWIATTREPYLLDEYRVVTLGWPGQFKIQQMAVSPSGQLHVASNGGLYVQENGGWRLQVAVDSLGLDWARSDIRGTTFCPNGDLWIACKAGAARRSTNGWTFFQGADGLPYNDFTCAAASPNGDVWFGTHWGAVRFDGKDWHYRQGRRWLPNDDVREIVVDRNNNAWIRTQAGVGVIEFQDFTLAEKALRYEIEIEKHIKRTPFGFVAEAELKKPGDRTSAHSNDSDNDGLWTAMYGAGECLGYAATREPILKARARKAFEALKFLQTVTQGGIPPAKKGFVARSIRSVDLPDPNSGGLDHDKAIRSHGDGLWKIYQPRWPKSADGKWYWKSDTSSDELDGHFFFYALYFDLCADTDFEKHEVRETVRAIADHFLENGFNFVDHDGTPTRWGVYAPDRLNLDPLWSAERGLNSLSLLTYLSVAEHVTDDAKYARAARELIDRQGYGANLMHTKIQMGVGSGNQSDDEMAFMCYYTLLRCSRDEALKARVRYSFYTYWALEEPELNPFFDFAYASQNSGTTLKSQWGEFPLNPWAGWLTDCKDTLYGFPLDRLNWAHHNSHRIDLIPLRIQQSVDLYNPRERHRGHRRNGKVLPIENRHFTHWNTDPWELDYGGEGTQLAAGTVFLLPYYMGMHHGFIEKP